MDLVAEQDIAAPIAVVFAALTDFPRLERDARARDIIAERSDGHGSPGVGTAWRIEYVMRGSKRRALSQITAWTPPEGFAIAAQSNLVDLAATLQFTALSPTMTRLRITARLGARSLPGRLFLHSARLARGRIDDRIARGLARLGARIAAEYQP